MSRCPECCEWSGDAYEPRECTECAKRRLGRVWPSAESERLSALEARVAELERLVDRLRELSAADWRLY